MVLNCDHVPFIGQKLFNSRSWVTSRLIPVTATLVFQRATIPTEGWRWSDNSRSS